jgi:hypothetical protein
MTLPARCSRSATLVSQNELLACPIIAPTLPYCHAKKMSDELSQRILAALVRAPDWLRRDLSSKDDANRHRAEEALSAMIVCVIEA